MAACELCSGPGGELLWQSPLCRVVRVDHPDYPGFCRVVLNSHVREMTDLDPAQRNALMQVVFATESVVRKLFAPDKINLASLGNMTPHVHWHIIPRWQTDRHFPEPIWGSEQRQPLVKRPAIDTEQLARAIAEAMSGLHRETT